MSKTEQVRGVQFNYVNFLWKVLSKIWELQSQGDHASALQTATDLIPYLPEGIKSKFKDRANEIEEDMQTLVEGVKEKSTDLFSRSVVTNRVLQKYARIALARFVDELCAELDKRGYMEKVRREVPSNVPPGFFEQATR